MLSLPYNLPASLFSFLGSPANPSPWYLLQLFYHLLVKRSNLIDDGYMGMLTLIGLWIRREDIDIPAFSRRLTTAFNAF